MARKQVNSATLIMGPTGSGKSFLIATLIPWLWETYQRILRLYLCDGGGLPAEVEKYVALGMIQLFRMRTRDPGDLGLAPETCKRSAQGWWPARIKPATGEVPPGVAMVPPFRKRWVVTCKNDHVVWAAPTAEVAKNPRTCPTCRLQVSMTANLGRVQEEIVTTPGFEKVGAVAYDGLTSMLAWQMIEMGSRHAKGELKGEGSALGGIITSGDLKFAGTNRADVGFAQTRGEEIVHLTLGIPGLVVPPIFTALTHEDVDDRSLNIRGPKISGRAKTDEAGAWVGNCLEAAIIPAEQGSGQQRVLYLDEFIDGANVRHLVKNRAAPGTMPKRLIDPPEDKDHPELAGTQFNLGLFFSMLGAAMERSIEQGKAQFPDAPGLPEQEEVTYGDQEAITQAVAKPAPVAAPAPAPKPAPTAAKKKPAAPVAVPAPVASVPQETPVVVDGLQDIPVAAPPQETPVTFQGAPILAEQYTPAPAPPVATPPASVAAPRAIVAPPPGVRPATAGRAPAGAPRIPAPRAVPVTRPAASAGPSKE